MITQEIKLYDEPVKEVKQTYQNKYNGYYSDFNTSQYTYKECLDEIQKARDLGLIMGVKFFYKLNPNRILTIVGFEHDTKRVFASNNSAGIILARDLAVKDSGTFHYSINELLSSDNLELIV